jgi:Domain of unknown function (DUF892)
VRTNTATLRDLWIGDLRTLSSLQRQIARALPRCIKAARSDDLRRAFEEQHAHHDEQAARLRRIFETLGVDGRGAFNRSAHSLVAEMNGAIRRRLPAQLRDVAAIAAIPAPRDRRVRHGPRIRRAPGRDERDASARSDAGRSESRRPAADGNRSRHHRAPSPPAAESTLGRGRRHASDQPDDQEQHNAADERDEYGPSGTHDRSSPLFRHFGSGLSRFGKPDRDSLFRIRDFAAGSARSQFAFLHLVHRTFDFCGRLWAILPLLGSGFSRQHAPPFRLVCTLIPIDRI